MLGQGRRLSLPGPAQTLEVTELGKMIQEETMLLLLIPSFPLASPLPSLLFPLLSLLFLFLPLFSFSSSFPSFFSPPPISFMRLGNGTQGLVHARFPLYHQATL